MQCCTANCSICGTTQQMENWFSHQVHLQSSGLAAMVQGVWEKDEVRKNDSFNTFEVSRVSCSCINLEGGLLPCSSS